MSPGVFPVSLEVDEGPGTAASPILTPREGWTAVAGSCLRRGGRRGIEPDETRVHTAHTQRRGGAEPSWGGGASAEARGSLGEAKTWAPFGQKSASHKRDLTAPDRESIGEGETRRTPKQLQEWPPSKTPAKKTKWISCICHDVGSEVLKLWPA